MTWSKVWNQASLLHFTKALDFNLCSALRPHQWGRGEAGMGHRMTGSPHNLEGLRNPTPMQTEKLCSKDGNMLHEEIQAGRMLPFLEYMCPFS